MKMLKLRFNSTLNLKYINLEKKDKERTIRNSSSYLDMATA